ncbi:DUF362 domain-containing protein [Terriglobus sp. TAA 43]|uniref:DUF362 domain-containing protein n=1 Tax=Terriglobus sp. TAA 43 TaxID=278961 RepID=UPI000646C616|nr:DUF362 domain-containing protein [Terriglobus sp. TAA 43]
MSDSTQGVVVALVTDPQDKFACFDAAVSQAGLLQALNLRCEQTSASAAKLAIFIKPDLNFYFKPATCITDPALVEHLVDWLHAAGYTNVTIGTAQNSSAFWLENRDPLILADLAGYRFETTQQNAYDFSDLSEDLCDAEFPATSILSGSSLNASWKNADFRISFAKAKTDDEFSFAGTAQNLIGVLPLQDTELQYYHRLRPEDVCNELLQHTPVHFAMVDAYLANHGSAGSRCAMPLAVSTIIASSSVTLADWTLANKFGVDPYASLIVAKLLREQGLPSQYSVSGDLSPFPAVKNVHPMVADAVAKRNGSLEVQRTAIAWLQSVDRLLFPFKDAMTDRINSTLAAQFGSLDADPLSFAAFLSLNYTLGNANQLNDASKVMFAKDKLKWMERPLNISLQDLTAADYEASQEYMEPLEQLVLQFPPDANGMRLHTIDHSILFHVSREIPIPFDDFVAKVDITRSIRMMNDYIGGSCVPVLRDEAGRVTHQAERNIYLPQPNYTAPSGGQPIDVSKLEFARYTENEQKIWWRTIKSENNSARFDDGIVIFKRTPANEVEITIVGRQEFSLPVFWQMMQLDLNPALKNYLVADAYKNFFTKTIANFTAQFEQREYRVGQPWTAADTQPKTASAKLSNSLSELTDSARVAVDRLTSKLSLRTTPTPPIYVDADGFSHFAPPSNTPDPTTSAIPSWVDKAQLQSVTDGAVDFLKDLARAIQRDVAPSRTQNPES